MKKTFLATLGFIGLVALSCAVTKQNNGNSQYKNLKILPKDITHEQMDSVMHHFTGSLNVRCNFCHTRTQDGKWDYASDSSKHKLVARDMMHMTNDLNKKYFNLTGGAMTITTPLMVTCYTCHHGSTEPAMKVPPRQERPQQRPPGDTTRRNG